MWWYSWGLSFFQILSCSHTICEKTSSTGTFYWKTKCTSSKKRSVLWFVLQVGYSSSNILPWSVHICWLWLRHDNCCLVRCLSYWQKVSTIKYQLKERKCDKNWFFLYFKMAIVSGVGAVHKWLNLMKIKAKA